MSERINKARYWWGVLYPENMVSGWEEKLSEIVQVPFAYCIHSSDIDTKSEHRKDHVHLILVFPNTTTYKHALSIFSLLSDDEKTAVNTVQACVNIRHCYDYLIHDTESCKKAEKHLYEFSDRVTGNNFDIGCYEQVSLAEKQDMLRELCDFVIEQRFMNMVDFYESVRVNFDLDYFQVLIAYNAMLEKLTKGNYLKYGGSKEKNEDSCI